MQSMEREMNFRIESFSFFSNFDQTKFQTPWDYFQEKRH